MGPNRPRKEGGIELIGLGPAKTGSGKLLLETETGD